MADSTNGKAINDFRVYLARKYSIDNSILDVGIGAGTFVKSVDGFGYDVNPAGVDWLVDNGKYVDFYKRKTEFSCVTFFDSLEHIYDMDKALTGFNKTQNIIVSMPILPNGKELTTWKHFRQDEHFHYFTKKAFIEYMKSLDFECIYLSDMETQLGREDILTFVFN